MKILAIELSTSRGSAALWEDMALRAERSWDERKYPGQPVFAELDALLKAAGWSLEEVDVFAAGRGPGGYSGLRIAVSAAVAFALPGGKLVYCPSSGAALALETARRANAEHVAVVGDARRERAWYGLFRVSPEDAVLEGDWKLARAGELDAVLPSDALRVSADWMKLVPVLGPRAGRWIEEARYPGARFVAELTARRIEAGVPSEPPTPIYMHPPVFVPPKILD